MDTINTVLLLLVFFQVKHFIFDFPLQFPFMYLNKGKYGHWGGIAHAALHQVSSFFILVLFTDSITAILLSNIEGWIHYHIDWAKMRLNITTGWGPLNSSEFWTFLGLDQLLHQATYLGMVYYLCKNQLL